MKDKENNINQSNSLNFFNEESIEERRIRIERKILNSTLKVLGYVTITGCVTSYILYFFNVDTVFSALGAFILVLFLLGGMGLFLLSGFNPDIINSIDFKEYILKLKLPISIKIILYIITSAGGFMLGCLIILWTYNILVQVLNFDSFPSFSENKFLQWQYQLILLPIVLFLIFLFRNIVKGDWNSKSTI